LTARKSENSHHEIEQICCFPKYNRISEIKKNTLQFEQQTIGFVASYELNIESFNLEDLQFNLLQFKHAVQNHLLTQKISFEKRSITDLPEWFEMVCIVNCGSREEY
jgi:hypothetical protein